MFLLELIIDCILLVLDIKFLREYKKKKKTGLPVLPSIKIYIATISIALFFITGYSIYRIIIGSKKEAMEKIHTVENALNKEKESFGKYSEKLNSIIRNNPLKKDIILDYWGNEYFYRTSNNATSYQLISKGKDGLLNTDDDIITKN